jgi:hypothetical protein
MQSLAGNKYYWDLTFVFGIVALFNCVCLVEQLLHLFSLAGVLRQYGDLALETSLVPQSQQWYLVGAFLT